EIRLQNSVLQKARLLRPVFAGRSSERDLRVYFRRGTYFFDGINRQRTGNFAVRFASHAVRQDEQIQRFDDPERVLVVRTDAPQVRHATAVDLHGVPFQAFRWPARPPRRGPPGLLFHASRGLSTAKGFAPK